MVATGAQNSTPYISSTKLYFNPSTGEVSATDFNSLSDATFKTNLVSDIDSVNILNKIQTYAFEWKHSGAKSYGVMAQELELILPELVKTNPGGAKTVSYLPLIALLIDAVNKLSVK
jgi:hypothetical protein